MPVTNRAISGLQHSRNIGILILILQRSGSGSCKYLIRRQETCKALIECISDQPIIKQDLVFRYVHSKKIAPIVNLLPRKKITFYKSKC